MVDGREIKRGFFRDIDTFSSYSAESITYVAKGERVWIKCSQETGHLYQEYYCWNTFSGILLS
jgi:hypothetical protein